METQNNQIPQTNTNGFVYNSQTGQYVTAEAAAQVNPPLGTGFSGAVPVRPVAKTGNAERAQRASTRRIPPAINVATIRAEVNASSDVSLMTSAMHQG